MTSAALVIVGCVLAPVSVVGVWTSNQVTDTDRHVATVTPLASDPTIQEAVADRVTDEILGRLDIAGLVDEGIDALAGQGVPPRVADALRGLAGSAAVGVREFVRDRVGDFVRSDAFERLWVRANTRAHAELVALLSGEERGVLTDTDGTVSLDLGAVVEAVKQRLVEDGFTLAARVPAVQTQFTIVQSTDLSRAQAGFRLLDRWGPVLPWVSLACLAIGVLAARDRRRTLMRASLGVAASMVLLAVALAVGRSLYLDRLPARVSMAAAADVFDTVVWFLRTGVRAVLVAALVVAGGGSSRGRPGRPFAPGPRSSGCWTRRAGTATRGSGATAARSGPGSSRWPAWRSSSGNSRPPRWCWFWPR